MITLPGDVARAVLEATDGWPVIVIDGPAGAGKTSAARAVADLLGPRSVGVIHMDDLYNGWGGLDAELTDYLTEELEPQIRAGDDITHRCYDWHRGRFGPNVTLPATDVLIIEGVGSAQPALSDVADLSIWVEADPDVCRRRWLSRDGAGMTPHFADWTDLQSTHFARYATRSRCDLILPTD